jgi:hypothetical protein
MIHQMLMVEWLNVDISTNTYWFDANQDADNVWFDADWKANPDDDPHI